MHNRREDVFLKFMRLPLILILALVLASTTVVASGSVTDEEVVAVVNGTAITLNDFLDTLEAEAGVYVLSQMILDEVIRQKQIELGVQVDPNILAMVYNDIIAQAGGEQGFMYYLTQMGMTQEQFLEQIEFELTLTLLAQAETEVTAEEVIEFFLQNEEYFAQPELVNASHILVNTKAEADAIQSQLDAGGNFAELAAKNSLDTSNASDGGKLGYFPQGVMVPEFEELAFSLPLNQYGVVETSYGWHIVVVTDKTEPVPADLDAQWDLVEQTLIDYLAGDLQTYLQKLENEANVTIIRDRYK